MVALQQKGTKDRFYPAMVNIDAIQLYSECGPQKNSYDQLDNIKNQTKQKTPHKQKTTVKTTVSRYEQRNLIKLNKNNYRVLISLTSLLIIRTWRFTADWRTSNQIITAFHIFPHTTFQTFKLLWAYRILSLFLFVLIQFCSSSMTNKTWE